MIDIDKDLGFIVLLTEFRFTGLRATISTIQSNFGDLKSICVVPGDSRPEDIKMVKTICEVVKAKSTISSMINAGLEKSTKPWNLIVMSGNIIRYNPVSRYSKWINSEKDVAYRVIDKTRWKWDDSSIHGVLINKKAMEEVGAFPDDEESIQNCKLLWGAKALELGYKFKGLVGVKLI